MQIGCVKESKKLAVCLLCLLAVCPYTSGARPNKSKQYYNKNFDFCLALPSTWTYQESFTRNGAIFAPSNARTFSRQPQITVGAHIDQPSEQGDRPQTLDENVQSGIDSLRKYASAEGLRITKREDLVIQGLPARIVALQYEDTKSNEQWFSKDLNVIDQRHIVYFVELKCHPKDAAALERIFDALVRSLRLQCKIKTRTE